MTNGPGSDARLRGRADFSQVGRPARRERLRAFAEELRLLSTMVAGPEPGEDYADPDETPPLGEDHPEFDPLPG